MLTSQYYQPHQQIIISLLEILKHKFILLSTITETFRKNIYATNKGWEFGPPTLRKGIKCFDAKVLMLPTLKHKFKMQLL